MYLDVVVNFFFQILPVAEAIVQILVVCHLNIYNHLRFFVKIHGTIMFLSHGNVAFSEQFFPYDRMLLARKTIKKNKKLVCWPVCHSGDAARMS
jgi:hypothetical protein